MLENIGAGPAASGDNLISNVTTNSFVTDVIEASRQQPVLVDFWAPWCGPCKQLTPIIEKVVRGAKGKVKLAKMNIDEHPAIPGQMGIQSIPAVIAFVDGRPVDGFMGALPEGQVQAFIDKLPGGAGGADDLAAQIKSVLAQADAMLIEGNPSGAADIYAAVLGQEPDNAHALAGLARCYIETGELDQARQILGTIPEAKAGEAPVAAARAALDLAAQAAELGDMAELEAKLHANPLDHQARFDLALALNVRNRRDEAIDQLIEIIRKDRNWNEDGARKQLVQFFEVWGPTDEATLRGRRRLSSVLFS